jgi:hypothetical protein
MNTDNQKECCICFERIYYKNVSITECNHSFHTSCLLKYNNKKCPICRQSLYEENVNIVIPEERPLQPTSFDIYLDEANLMRKILYKSMYVISQVYVVIFIIFCLRIACELLWIFIYESHMAVAKYLF